MRSFIAIITYCVLHASAFSQKSGIASTDSTRISIDKLIGSWESADSAKNTIEFKDHNAFEFLLQAGPFTTYTFFKDSLNSVPSSGCQIAWPPNGCRIKLIDEDHLEVKYELYTGETLSISRYRRRGD